MKTHYLLLISIAVATLTRPAAATLAYADTEKISCGYCHVNPQGGGKRNYRGVFFKANNLTFKNFDDKAEAELAGEKVATDAQLTPKTFTKPLTLAEAAKKAKDAEIAHAQALAEQGLATLRDSSKPMGERAPAALKLFNDALAKDGTNRLARAYKRKAEEIVANLKPPVAPAGKP
jgi:hypothetical protein